MERINCPACGRLTRVIYGTDIWGAFGEVLIQHSVPGERWIPCVTGKLRPGDAVAVGRILTEGGERLRLAAHP